MTSRVVVCSVFFIIAYLAGRLDSHDVGLSLLIRQKSQLSEAGARPDLGDDFVVYTEMRS
jgi:hypothetical protein